MPDPEGRTGPDDSEEVLLPGLETAEELPGREEPPVFGREIAGEEETAEEEGSTLTSVFGPSPFETLFCVADGREGPLFSPPGVSTDPSAARPSSE